jgi:ribonuclease HI
LTKEFFSNLISDQHEVNVYTDGACSKNPGPGGWGAVILAMMDEQKIELHGGEPNTTNNRMEMMAAVKALSYIFDYKPDTRVNIYTDSKYLQDGINSWIKKWKNNNWMTAVKQPVKNKDLWQLIDNFSEKMQISWNWVPGHAGVKYNEEADMLARKAIIALKMAEKFP